MTKKISEAQTVSHQSMEMVIPTEKMRYPSSQSLTLGQPIRHDVSVHNIDDYVRFMSKFLVRINRYSIIGKLDYTNCTKTDHVVLFHDGRAVRIIVVFNKSSEVEHDNQ